MNRISYTNETKTEVISINSKRMSRLSVKELAKLTRQLREVSCELHCAYAAFNAAVEDDLIYSSIYEINMLRSRHTYLLRRIKQLQAAPADERNEQWISSSAQAQPSPE